MPWWLAWFAVTGGVQAEEPAYRLLPAERDAVGVLTHRLESRFQETPTRVRVLLPSTLQPGKRYPVLYVLPVEAKDEHRFGDGLQQIQQDRLADRCGWICVVPEFSRLPWYADHPRTPRLQQESHFLHAVLPAIEENYPTLREPAGRLLLGFSKSGFGAVSLIARNPERFAAAAAWDAPFALDKPGKYGSGEIYGDQETFDKYQPLRVLAGNPAPFRQTPRLVVLGFGSFRAEHQAFHAELERLQIPHVYRDGPQRGHRWETGWVLEAARELQTLTATAVKPQ